MDPLILAGLLLAAGMMGDRFGRRRFLAIGMVIFGAGAAGAALATSSETLILFRGIQGAGAALVLPATLSIITDVFPVCRATQQRVRGAAPHAMTTSCRAAGWRRLSARI